MEQRCIFDVTGTELPENRSSSAICAVNNVANLDLFGMSGKSTEFERRVERIHRLLEGEDAVVTWDERIRDPDNPSQLRQIDVTIRRSESFTIIECRIHAQPQEVTWIEELIGRRASLRADAVIAVSSSGFTQGAKAKAAEFGIIVRDFNSLTQEEIRNWGKQRKVHLTFYEFTNSIITFRLQAPPVPPIMTADYQGNPVNWRGLFQPIMQRLDDDARLDLSGATGEVEMEFDAPIFINGERAAKTSLSCRIRRITREVLLSSVVAYDDASAGGQPPKAIVGSLDLGTSEIVEAADAVTLVVDLSQISIPASCLFHKIGYDFGRVVELRGTQFIGLPDAMRFQSTVNFRFERA